MVEEKAGGDQVVNDGKIFAVIGYIGILCLLPLLLKKDNAFALHHGKQGLVIFIGGVISSLLLIIPILGWILSPIIWLFLVVMAIIGIVQAASGSYWRAPIIADLAAKINF